MAKRVRFHESVTPAPGAWFEAIDCSVFKDENGRTLVKFNNVCAHEGARTVTWSTAAVEDLWTPKSNGAG